MKLSKLDERLKSIKHITGAYDPELVVELNGYEVVVDGIRFDYDRKVITILPRRAK